MLTYLTRSPLHRRRISTVSTRVGLSSATGSLAVAGLLGVLYYTAQTVYADEESEDEGNQMTDRRALWNIAKNAHSRQGNAKEQFNHGIRLLEASGTIAGDTGVARFDTASIPHGMFWQTIHAVSSVHLSSGTSWTFFGLFEGHNGARTSHYLGRNLIPNLIDALLAVYRPFHPPDQHTTLESYSDPEPLEQHFNSAAEAKFKEVFRTVDNRIVYDAVDVIFSSPSREKAVPVMETAQSASSALVAFLDSETHILRIGSTGNSRAILGRSVENEDGRPYYSVHVLTEQATPSAVEPAHFRSSHPNKVIVGSGRFVGGDRTAMRVFGDAAHKWGLDTQIRLHQEYLGDPPLENVRDLPCITAEPEVTSVEVKQGDFLIMGSSGLWNSLTNEEVVGLVGLWIQSRPGALDQKQTNTQKGHSDGGRSTRIVEREDLPTTIQDDNTTMYTRWRTEKRFTNADDNAATHLARNALGGAHRDLTAALLSLQPPHSRRLRDEISATVVFF